ncbi:hypothetical protein GW796_08110 [archaeon]|nr:hypothetical protein [archaeon]
MWKFFLPCYFQSKNAFAINMSNPENNKLFAHMKKLFKVFDIKIEPNYLYSFSGKTIVELESSFWEKNLIVSNNGDKDIIIKGKNKKLFHIVSI